MLKYVVGCLNTIFNDSVKDNFFCTPSTCNRSLRTGSFNSKHEQADNNDRADPMSRNNFCQ